MNKQFWPAIILILIGILLILYQTDLLDFSTADLVSYEQTDEGFWVGRFLPCLGLP
jgi:hypothetical protein